MLLTCTSENTLGYHFLFKWKRVGISFKKQQLTHFIIDHYIHIIIDILCSTGYSK